MLDAAQILRQTLQTTRFDDFVREQSAPQEAAESGRLMGLELEMMEDPMADLMDSMEELSGQFEEKALKDVAQRKLGRLQHGKTNAASAAIEKWLKTFPDMPGGEFLDRLMRTIRQQQSARPSPKELLRLLSRGSADPSHQYAMLEILEQMCRGERDAGELQKLIREAREQLNAEKGDQVRAGINLAQEVNARAKTSGEMQELRDLYRGEVLGFTKPQDCFRSLLASRGAGRLSEALDFLLKGCGVDMQSASPSRSPEELRRIMLDLQSVSVLRTLLEKCDALTAKMLGEFGETSILNGEKLTGRIVDFTEMPFVGAKDVAALLQTCGFAQLLAKVYFSTRLTELFRGLSPRLFADGNDRFKMVDAAQEHLDGLVSLQEEEEKKRREKEDAA